MFHGVLTGFICLQQGGGCHKGVGTTIQSCWSEKKHMELHIKWQEQTTYRNMNNVHEVDYLRRGFGLVIWFIGYLQIVTTIITLLLIYIMYSHSILISSVDLHKSSRVYNTGTIIVSLNHTFKILNINKIFKSHVKSSEADLLYSSVLLVPIRSVRVLPSLLPLFPASLEILFTHIAEERTLTNSKQCFYRFYSFEHWTMDNVQKPNNHVQ
jgi:hypothetical protein